jgi:hypothetical protein
VSQLDSQYKRLADENASLRFRKDSILSVEKMDKIAREKNLKRVQANEVVYLDNK